MPVIVLDGLTKRFGSHVAVDSLTASVRPGRVTRLLGPDGSGRTTILRCILGLARPTSGSAIVLGRRYRQLPRPLRQVGALVGDGVGRPHRTAYQHLRSLAQSNGLPARRVHEVIELVGLGSVAHERVRTLPYAGGRRLGLAVALLGDPEVLLLDEPLTGLDRELHDQLAVELAALPRATRTSTVLVTHDEGEAATLADRTVLLSADVVRDNPA